MARRAMGWVLMLLTLLMVGCDHATKLAAQTMLDRHQALSIVPGLVDLRYAENRETAFSLTRALHFPGKAAFMVTLSIVGLAAVLFLGWRRRAAHDAERVAYALIIAGALGNVLDRLLRGYVVDFIEVHHWPIFNVADVAVVVGALLVLVTRGARSDRGYGET